MNDLPIEPPPLPKNRADRSSAELSTEDMRSNQLMVAGALVIVTLFILILFFLLWFGGKAKGLGDGQARGTQGDDISVMGATVESKPAHDSQSEQNAGNVSDKDNIADAGKGMSDNGGQDGQAPPTSQSAGEESPPDDEALIAIPSGKVSGDAVAVTLGDAFNPFAEASNGKEVIYVIDVSGSMDGDRYRRVSIELIEAIQGLKEHQRFNIILFSSHATVFRDTGLVAATKDMKRTAAEWLRSQYCGGGTDPSDALEKAIQFAPEKIVVLSDGEFDSAIPVYITALNQSLRATIDCIGFDPQSFTLKELAASNGPGRFYAVR